MHSLAFGSGWLSMTSSNSCGFGAALSYELVYDPIPIWNVLANEFLSTPQGTPQSGDLTSPFSFSMKTSFLLLLNSKRARMADGRFMDRLRQQEQHGLWSIRNASS